MPSSEHQAEKMPASQAQRQSAEAPATATPANDHSPDFNPKTFTASRVMQLQRTFGNQFVSGLLTPQVEKQATASPDRDLSQRMAVQRVSDETSSDTPNQLQRVAVQRQPEDINAGDESTTKQRAQDRTGAAPSEESINGPHGSGITANAMVVRGGSMAADPAFEANAQEWENSFGGVAYKDPRAIKVVNDSAKKAVDYLTKKAKGWDEGNKELQTELAKVHITDTGWSGGVGNTVNNVMKAFTKGSLGVKIAHVENFCNKVLAEDLLNRDEKGLHEILDAAKIDKDGLKDAQTRIKDKKSVYALHNVQGPAADQWHMRAARNPSDKAQNISTRTVKQVEDGGVKLDKGEKSFMGLNKDDDKLKWAEGARIWALNERDKWVHTMRQLNLPLAAGVSGTTARMMQSFSMLGVGNPADNRLACIAYLLPTKHHSLTEIMEGAAGNGGPAFTPNFEMYSKIEPYKADELRGLVGKPFPHEAMQAKSKVI